MTTLATFYDTYRDLSLSGVSNLNDPPGTLDKARMPCKFVWTAGLDEAPLRAKTAGGARKLRCQVVVVVAPRMLSTQKTRWTDTLAMVDTLNTAIKTVATTNTEWTIVAEPAWADDYMAVVADIVTTEWSA